MTTVERIDGSSQPGSMPLTAHLTELRGRILWSILAIAVGGSIGFAWGEPIVEAFKAQLPSDVELQQIELGDGFAIRIQIAFVVGVILAMPVLLLHHERTRAASRVLDGIRIRRRRRRCRCRRNGRGIGVQVRLLSGGDVQHDAAADGDGEEKQKGEHHLRPAVSSAGQRLLF